MADVDFRVKNGLVVDNGSISLTNTTSTSIAVGTVSLNATGFYVGNSTLTSAGLTTGNSTVNTNIGQATQSWTNSTATVTANTSGVFVGANVYANLTTLVVGGATVNSTLYSGKSLTANNASYFGGFAPGYYTDATNIVAGKLPYAQIPVNIINTTGTFTISGVYNHTANVAVNGAIIVAGSSGTAGQMLTSNGSSNAYWSTPTTLAGSNTQVQFNDSGVQGASSQLVFNKATNNLSVGNTVVTGNSSIRSTNLTLGGQITANGSTGTSGFLLTSGGASTNAYWATAPSTVAGSTTQIQYNNSGTLAGAAGLTWTNSSNSLALGASGKISFGNSTVNTTISADNLTFWSGSRLGIFGPAGIQLGGTLQANGSDGTAGYILTSGGASTNAYWATAPSSVAGSNTQIQYNNSDTLAASAALTFNNTTNSVSVSNSATISGALGVGTAASSTAGEIRATNNITAYYSSDARLKENVRPITNALEDLLKLRGVRFDWTDDFIQKSGGEDGYFVRKQDVGIIAQELEAVLPELVIDRQDGFKAVKYDRIVALLIEAVKELKIEVDLLKQK